MSREQAEAIVKKLLQEEGKFEQKNMVVVITGLMGAGKTTLLHWLFGKTPPPEYTSTGTAEQVWRTLAHHTAYMKEFKFLEVRDMLELVAKVKKVPSKTTEEADKHNIKPATEDNPNALAKASKQDGTSQEGSIGKTEEEGTTAAIAKMADIVRKNPEEKYVELELIHMIDTGGQPECLEVLPSMIHNANVVLLVVDISKSLDECVSPTLHKGGSANRKDTLPTTNRQMIEQLAQTMAGRRESIVLVIATHTDQVPSQDLPKELDKLNKFVDEVLPHGSIFQTSSKTAIGIAFSPHEPPADTIKGIICGCIKDEINKMKPFPAPTSFVLFESEAMHYLSEKRASGDKVVNVMELKECLKIGKNLSMSPDVVKAALKYFHDNNIFLYFENVGPGLVFIDPKSLINFVNIMVEFSYRIRGEENLSLSMAARSALKEGTITRKIWEHKDVKNNFVRGIFEECHAKTIFKTLYIIASRSFALDQSKPSTETENDEEYIMMCLLPRLSQEEVQHRLKKFGQTKPLLIHFGKGSPPFRDQKLYSSPCGSFGSIIACLISKFDWKICPNIDKQQPECLYHDIAMLRPSIIKSLKVTLVNKTKYFEIYVDLKGEKECEVLKVRDDIRRATELVLNSMQLNLNVAEGFVCTCGEWKKQHTQFLIEDSKEYRCVGGIKGEPQVFWIGSGKQGM